MLNANSVSRETGPAEGVREPFWDEEDSISASSSLSPWQPALLCIHTRTLSESHSLHSVKHLTEQLVWNNSSLLLNGWIDRQTERQTGLLFSPDFLHLLPEAGANRSLSTTCPTLKPSDLLFYVEQPQFLWLTGCGPLGDLQFCSVLLLAHSFSRHHFHSATLAGFWASF